MELTVSRVMKSSNPTLLIESSLLKNLQSWIKVKGGWFLGVLLQYLPKSIHKFSPVRHGGKTMVKRSVSS